VHSDPTEQDKIACIRNIHNTCTPRPCFRHICFTPFSYNAPYQFTPLLNFITGIGSFSPLLGVRKKLYMWYTGHIYLKLVIWFMMEGKL